MKTSLLRPRRLALVSLAAATLLPAIAAAQTFPSNDSLTAILKSRVGTTGVGIVLGVLETDGTTRVVSYGSPGLGAKPLGPKATFEMGSITKVFTGILLADLVESKKVALTDPVQKYLPAGVTMPTRNGEQITLLDLATHRSSLTRMPTNINNPTNSPYPKYTIPEMYAYLSGHQLRRDIGSEYEYSNIAVALLGHVIERVNGKSYEELVQEKILRPLGMRSSSTKMENVREWLTVGHDENGLVAQARGWEELPGMGALRSNAEDMLRFLAANVAEPTTRLHRLLRMSHEPRQVVTPNVDIGLNWQIHKYGNQRIITHGGATQGFRAQAAFDPATKRGVVLMANYPAAASDIAFHLLNSGVPLAGAAVAERNQVDVSENILREYVADYELTPAMAINVTLEDGTLHAQATGQGKFAILPSSESRFFARNIPLEISFTRDSARKVTGLVVHQGGRDRAGRRRLALGVPLASAAEIAAALPGRKTTVPSAALGRDVAVRVVVPTGYELTQSLRYPVLYVLETERPLHSASAVAGANAQGNNIPQLLVVSVTGVPSAAERANFAKFLTAELQPWVAKEYRTEPLAIVAGDAATVGAVNVPAKIVTAADVAARASYRGQQQPVTSVMDPHAALGESLRWVFDGWKLADMSKLAQAPDTGWKVIDAHYARLSDRFGFKAVPPEALFDDAAGALAQQRRYEEAVRAFEKNTTVHPGSAVTWNHLGDGLRYLCKREESKAAYTKAHELAQAMAYNNVSNYSMELNRVTQEIASSAPCNAPGAVRATVPVAEPILRSYVGEYALSARISIAVTMVDGRLHAQPTGEPARALGALSETRFFIEGSTVELAFTKNAGGVVTGVVMHQGGREIPGTKVK
jgi:D-alanyl-D-alanine-carboxypeptidase/D-alanyl-D-alanine-endopeptidase